MHKIFDRDKPLLLVFPYNVMAHYLRCLQLARYLQPYFSIRFLNSVNYHSFIDQAGYETFECAALDSDKVQYCISSFDFSWLNESDLSKIYYQQVRTIKELGASAVLGDMSPTLKMAAEKTGAYYFSLINGYMTRYYAHVRRMSKSNPLYKLFNLLPNSLFQYFTNVGEHLFFYDMQLPFRTIRKHEKLQQRYSYLHEMEGDANLICDLPELFPQKELPANYYFIPPVFHRLNNAGASLNEIMDPGKRTLLVSMGSTGNWKNVAFLNQSKYIKYNIITAADHQKVLQGVNVFPYTFINSSKVFSNTDLVICHGGNGTIYQSLSFGIPVLCHTSHFEQDYNVDGLERLRLGKFLDGNNETDNSRLIEEWSQKKNNRELSYIKNKITIASNNFEETIRGMLEETFFSETPVMEVSD